jgi:hypothetical protein
MTIYFSNNTNIADVSGALQFQTANTTRLNITTTGEIASSGQPAFHVLASAATSPVGSTYYVGLPVSTGLVTWNATKVFDTGNDVNTGNGRFTAPIAGVYYFKYNQLVTTAGEYRLSLFKNGSGYGGLRFIKYKTTGNFDSFIIEGHVYLAATDYVTIVYESGPTLNTLLWADGSYGSFSGHLVG